MSLTHGTTVNKAEPSVIASWAGTLGRALAARGVAPESVFAQAGLDYSQCTIPDARFPHSNMVVLWERALSASGDRNFPLGLARFIQPMTISSLGLGLMASSTGTEGLQRLERYSRIVTNSSYVDLDLSKPDEVVLELVLNPNLVNSHYGCEALMAMIASLSDLARGSKQASARKRVEFSETGPDDLTAFEQHFGCPVVFNTGHYRIFYDRARLDLPLPHANPQLASLNDKASVEYLARIENGGTADRVRGFLIRKLPSGEPSRHDVAQALNLSDRSLLRHLEQEQTSYRQILDQLRRELSEQHLRAATLNIKQIAFLLGFHDQNSFTRSFKRWNGIAPTVWNQKTHQGEPAAPR